jgi:hypothetical protein
MTETATSIPVQGTVRQDPHGVLFVLDERLNSYDTFLSGRLDIGQASTPVRIITLDDITVLRPMEATTAPIEAWSGTLHLPHGIRQRSIPDDLADAAQASQRALDALDSAELRYALTFLNEATTEPIRTARIAAIVAALPHVEGEAP